MLSNLLVKAIRDRRGEFSDGFRPFEGSPFPGGEQRRLPPDREVVKAQFAFTVNFRFFYMHIQTECAAIDLRCPDVDKIDQTPVESFRIELTQFQQFLDKVGRMLVVVDSWIHDGLLFESKTR